jgi:hypothetical protein
LRLDWRGLDRLAVANELTTVYNLQTEHGTYIANGVVVHNCHFSHTHVRGPWASQPRMLPMAYDSGGDLADLSVLGPALGEMARAGVRGVIWSGGGEPTTHPQWLEAVSRADFVGLEQGMYTAGGLLTQHSAKALATTAKWIVISLDTVDAATYAIEKGVAATHFTAACHGARWLAEAQSAVVGISFLLHAKNWFRADEMLALARSLGATYATFRPTIQTSPDQPSVCTEDRSWITAALMTLGRLALERDVECDVDRFLQYRDWTGRSYATCYGIRLSTVMTPDGRLWVCPQRRGCADSCLGDLRTESFDAIWARHAGAWTDFTDCRVMCRLHLMNQELAEIYKPRAHEAFV